MHLQLQQIVQIRVSFAAWMHNQSINTSNMIINHHIPQLKLQQLHFIQTLIYIYRIVLETAFRGYQNEKF